MIEKKDIDCRETPDCSDSCATGTVFTTQITPSAIAQTGSFSATTYATTQYSQCFQSPWMRTVRAFNRWAIPQKIVRTR